MSALEQQNSRYCSRPPRPPAALTLHVLTPARVGYDGVKENRIVPLYLNMYLWDLENVHGNPRLHRPTFTLKNFGQPCI